MHKPEWRPFGGAALSGSHILQLLEDVVAVQGNRSLLFVQIAVNGRNAAGEPDRRVPIGRSGREIEQQLGEFFQVLVAEAILADQHADKVLPGQQSVDIQIERLRQLRPGGFANGLFCAASPQDAAFCKGLR